MADDRTLIRRMYYDVIGLPPSTDELRRWSEQIGSRAGDVKEQGGRRFDAVSELVDHLLASPHFGERWGRYWLDLVRYAETSGYERDQPKPFAWKYRDWVVDAINSDMPCDRFVRLQLAGDEIEQRNEQSLIGTGFLRLGTWNDEPNDDADYQYERLEDMVHVTSSAFLGLTAKCARCHDHKFDPIPQDDYYRLASVFWPGPIAARDRKLLGGPTAEELGTDNVLGWTDLSSDPGPLHVLKNGERDKPLNVVEPGSLTFATELFRAFTPAAAGADTTGRRRQLAEWITDPRNPLTARVYVNRIWQHHFGEGLVRSPNNFGFKGEQPTHPELLDWLASEFVDNGWSAKHIHRLILTSQTWQQSSLHRLADEYSERDSANRLWWRANRQRLDAETLRDSMLAVTGEIDLRVGGEGFKPTISKEALEGFSRKDSVWQAADEDEQRRRSLYIFVSRSLMPPMMTTFDQCDTTLPCGQRDVTTVAPQALAMLNNEFAHACSEALAFRAESVGNTTNEQIEAAWEFALGRSPTATELRLAAEHVASQRLRFQASIEHGVDSDGSDQTKDRLPAAVLRLAADSGVTTDANGSVETWEDVVGRSNAAQPHAGFRPLLVRNGMNGHPVMRFDGNRRFLKLSGEVIEQEHCTIVAVATDTSPEPRLREIISNWNRERNVGSSVFLGLRDTDTVRFTDHFSSAGKIVDRNEPFILTAVNSPDGVRVWQGNRAIASRSQSVTGRRFGTDWVIGQQGNIDGEYWHGDIAEILVFDRPVSEEQLGILWHELADKYGIDLDVSLKSEEDSSPAHRALASLCHVLLNSNEFLYVD